MCEKRGGVSAGCVNMYSQINAIVVKLLYMGMLFNTEICLPQVTGLFSKH